MLRILSGSVYELMKSVSGFTVSDLDILFDFIDKFGRWRSRDFTHKYDHRSSEGKGFIDKIFRGAHDEHVLKVPSYITWRRLQSQFRSLDSSDCTDLVKTFPALSKLGSCGEGSTVAPQTRPNLRLSRSPEAYIGNEPFCSFYGVQSSILTYFKTAIRILKSSGLYLRKLRKRIEEHLKSTVDELDQGYLSKHKGPDRAQITIESDSGGSGNHVVDEVKEHLNTRYVCPPQALHIVFGFAMQEKSHTVCRLAVHLPEYQTVCFVTGQEQQALDGTQSNFTTLTAYIELNRLCANVFDNGQLSDMNIDAREIFYCQIPEHFSITARHGNQEDVEGEK
ncbi:hypothetical protein NECAME_04572 [Necator americanus]|uniref:Uncharacterized protein n=1 Tax=Necator americanus TaxID=51031 RepID=W2SQR6_NECAM|nr:hypothetical protein NECAME_04572 [Necator americanus]ETN71828.1 hypothetical protein NECAME_04572 [Necator americanus]